MNIDNRIALQDYLKNDEYNVDENLANINLLFQLIDIWGEVSKLSEDSSKQEIADRIDLIDKLCSVVYSSKNIPSDYIYSLKVNEWLLLDYYLWGNGCCNTESGAKAWFRQWSFDCNFEQSNHASSILNVQI